MKNALLENCLKEFDSPESRICDRPSRPNLSPLYDIPNRPACVCYTVLVSTVSDCVCDQFGLMFLGKTD